MQTRFASHHFCSGDDRFALSIPDEMLDFAARQCRRAGQRETGGIIIGYYDADLKQATVTQLTGPPPDSRAQKTWFYRGTRGLIRKLEQVWHKHKRYYLGEWHFHPCGPLLPSSTDEAQMKAIALDKNYLCPEPLLILVGLASDKKRNVNARAFVFPNKENWQELAPEEPRSYIES